MEKKTELMYQEQLTIRRALEHYAQCKHTWHPLVSPATPEEREESERLERVFHNHKIIVVELE
jgi:hypothetical protein